jgi:hypothetical protein
MDRFASLIQTSNCSDSRDLLTYTFTNASAYQSAKQEWDWVNQMTSHNFILTVHMDDCYAGANDSRQLYQVNTITWDDDQHMATLVVAAKAWEEVLSANDETVKSWELFVDSKGLSSSQVIVLT